MSVTVSNCDEICNSPTNLSHAKMLYTFHQEPRFRDKSELLYISLHSAATNSTTCPTKPAEPPRWVSVTNTILRKSTIHDEYSVPASPPPNSYTIKSEFGLNGLKGVGFGKGR